MWRVVKSDWTVVLLGLALLGTLWLRWDSDDTGWESFTYTDVSVCLAAAAAFALWLKDDSESGWQAVVAPVASAVALMAIVASVLAPYDDAFGAYAGLGCAAVLTATCFAATRFARWRSTDWSVDVAAAALLASMFLPWLRDPSDDPFFAGYDGRDAWRSFTHTDVLMLVAVVTALASAHTRGPLANPWIPVRAAAVATVAMVVGVTDALRLASAYGGQLDLRYGAPIGLACVLGLLAVTLSAARGARRSGDLGEPGRGGVAALD